MALTAASRGAAVAARGAAARAAAAQAATAAAGYAGAATLAREVRYLEREMEEAAKAGRERARVQRKELERARDVANTDGRRQAVSAGAAEAEVRRRLAKEVERAEAAEAEAAEFRERAEKLARALSRAGEGRTGEGRGWRRASSGKRVRGARGGGGGQDTPR